MFALVPSLLALAVQDAEWVARYDVTFVDDPGGHRARVEATLAWTGRRGASPESVELSMNGDHAALLVDFEARPPTGDFAPQPLRVPISKGGRGEFRYTVPLEAFDPEEMSGWDETPHAFADGTLWTGRALFATPGDARAEVVFHVPEGQHVSTSLDPAEEGGYSAPTGSALRETYLLVGEHYETTLELPGATVFLAIDGDAAESAELIEHSVQSFLAIATETMGGPPPARCLIALTRAEREGGGSVYGRDAHILVPGPPVADGDLTWRQTLCHESFHLWNPQKVGFDSREMWFSEGFTDYYAHLLLARSGEVPQRAFLDRVRDWTAAYRGEDPIGLRQAGVLGAKNNVVIYQGGALAALCLDVLVRDGSAGARSLDDVMQGLYALGERNGGPVSIDELQRLLEKLGGRSVSDFLERHVAGAEPLPLDEVFALAGLLFEERTVRVPERTAAIVHLFQCSGMTVVDAGIEVNRSEGGRLKPGDIVLEVAGRGVEDFGDLQRALADRVPGDEVDVVVLREGEREEVEVRLGGHGLDLPSTEGREVVLEPLPKTPKRARKIREALFGELR